MKKQLLKKYKLLILLIEVVVFLLAGLSVFNYYIKLEGKKSFYLPQTDTDILYKTLEENNYTMYPMDKLYFPFITLPQQGWYTIDQVNDGRFNFFERLHTYKIDSHKIKIYAGETAYELSQRLAKNLDLNATKLFTAYQKYTRFGEGDIFSGEYSIGDNLNEERVMQHLFHGSETKLKSFEKKYENITNNPLEHRILLTIASIIQKESNAVKEMPLISSVIYNRLEKNMKLQMDGTLNYGKYSHKVVKASRIKTDTSEYNTYKYKGLPPTPLCTISMEALEAAYLPETTDYLFFMLNRDGTHNFEASYQKHLANIRAFKQRKKKPIQKSPSKVAPKDTNLSMSISSL
jgi:UPF0755 protein